VLEVGVASAVLRVVSSLVDVRVRVAVQDGDGQPVGERCSVVVSAEVSVALEAHAARRFKKTGLT